MSGSVEMEKVKFQVEYPVNSSKGVLFNMFSTPSGLAEWFCDDVNIKQDVHTFVWDGSEESARIISKKREDFIKFRWIEDEEAGIPSFFEFRIKIDDMTGDTAIVITDFAEEDEIESSKELWGAQVDRLKQILGA
jgi:uncharacterized protein YndB with AHSA1/START domain